MVLLAGVDKDEGDTPNRLLNPIGMSLQCAMAASMLGINTTLISEARSTVAYMNPSYQTRQFGLKTESSANRIFALRTGGLGLCS